MHADADADANADADARQELLSVRVSWVTLKVTMII